MSVLNDLSSAFAENVKALSPAVVRVEARRRLPATGIIWSAEGYIITANHVVKQNSDITISLHDGGLHPATLVGRDMTTDLALLKTEAEGLTVPQWADLEAVAVGNLVLALGRPGRSIQATLGVVSALGGAWRTPAGGKITHYLQTDVIMYPGFSGGPLVGASGQVIGLNTSGLLRGGVSVAVPYPTLKAVADDLLAHGRVRRGYLGVAMQPARLPQNLQEELGQETGLLIVSVESGSPAEQAGILMGDTIVSFDGEPVLHLDHLMAMLTGDVVGQSISLKIVRGGVVQTITVTVGEHE